MKVENIKVVNFDNAFRGMRNPKNSWKLSDSRILREPLPNEEYYIERKIEWDSKFSIDNLYNSETKQFGFCIYNGNNPENKICELPFNPVLRAYYFENNGYTPNTKENHLVYTDDIFLLGEKDLKLAKTLISCGPVHSKFARQIFVSMDITASFDFWKEFDTYKVGTTSDSTSTMHKITSKEIDDDMFASGDLRPYDIEKRKEWIKYLEEVRTDSSLSDLDKTRILSKQNLVAFEQMRTVTMSYTNLESMFRWRKGHKLLEWRYLCNEIILNLPYFKQLYTENMDKNK